jgi:hypothetical protein
MKESQSPNVPHRHGADGARRLLTLVGRSAPPHRPVGGLLLRWYAASGTALLYDEWADPATSDLAAVFDRSADVAAVEQAVVRFAQARAGAGHDVDAVTADLMALVRLGWPTGRGSWGETIDPVALLARAVGAWAVETTHSVRDGQCVDEVTGLVTAQYLKERVRELHDHCRALAISPPVTFGAVVVQLAFDDVSAPDRVGARIAVARDLAARFRAGETVAAVAPGRMVAVMPAYGVGRAVSDVADRLAGLDLPDGVTVTVGRLAFAGHAEATVRRLVGSPAGA